MVGPKPHSVLREQFKPMPDPDFEISGCVKGGGGNTEVKWEGNISRIKGAEEREDLVLRGLLQKK